MLACLEDLQDLKALRTKKGGNKVASIIRLIYYLSSIMF